MKGRSQRSSTIAPEPHTAQARPPLTALAAAWVAYAALALAGDGYLVMTGLGLALLGTHVWNVRWAKGSWTSWMVRVILFSIVVVANVMHPALDGAHGIYDPSVVHGFGQLLAAELVVQCWRQDPVGGRGGAVVILLSGLVLLTACNVRAHQGLRYLTPVYMVFLILTLRGLSISCSSRREQLRRSIGGRVGACLFLGVIVFGATTSYYLKQGQSALEQLVRDLDLLFLVRQPSVGFSDHPILGRRQNVHRSMTRALQVKGPLRGPYLRGAAYEQYVKGRWEPALSRRTRLKVSAASFQPGASGSRCVITRLLDDLELLFLPLHCSGFVPSRVGEVEQDEQDAGSIFVSAPAPYTYGVVADRSLELQGPLCSPIDTDRRQRCLELPAEIQPGVRALALKIAGHLKDPRERVSAIENYFQSRYTYSLQIDPGRGDPVSNFVLKKMPAHCEYFASAACIMLRHLDIPTRYVSGFYAHEPAGPEALVVRQQDAHAWAESWIEGVGWITVDATPPEGGRPNSTSSRPPLWLRAWEWINETALAIGDWFYERSWAETGGLLGGTGGLFISLLWLREVWLRGRKGKRGGGIVYASSNEALNALRRRFERLLKKNGLSCPAHLPWSEHLATAARRENSPHGDLPRRLCLEALAFERAYRAVRFGPPEGRDAIALLEQQLEALEKGQKNHA